MGMLIWRLVTIIFEPRHETIHRSFPRTNLPEASVDIGPLASEGYQTTAPGGIYFAVKSMPNTATSIKPEQVSQGVMSVPVLHYLPK